MRYAESREKSEEFLRLALALMARQAAALHPVTYALWYEHVAGINPALSRVLDERLQASTPLSEEDVYELHARYIVTRDLEVLAQQQLKLRTLLEETAHATATAVEDTGRFEVTLAQTRTRLTAAPDLSSVHSLVAELQRETTRMHSVTQSVSEKLESRAREVSLLTEQLERAQAEASVDSLTGLKNRRGFERAVAELYSGDANWAGTALLIADVDCFKEVNDAHGHLLGDKVLRAIAQTLQSSIKGRDIAARIGGDEFAVLLRELTPTAAAALAEQLRASIEAGRIRRSDGKQLPGTVTVSVGVALGRAGDSLEAVLARADGALYSAKRNGRNRIGTATD
jgi:diguanylate cyclase